MIPPPSDNAASAARVEQCGPPSCVDEVVYLGVSLALLDAAEAAARIAAREPFLPFGYVVTPNAAHFTRLVKLGDERFRDAVDHAWLRLLDGQTPRLLARLLFGMRLAGASGSDVTALLLARHLRPDDAITVIGGEPALPHALTERFGLSRVAQHIPPMGFIRDPDAVDACIDFVLAYPARYVFLVTGAPQSEYLARMIQRRGDVVGCGLCVGSGLNFSAGILPRAPRALREAGLEWAYRLARNPVGHARRVFVDSLPIFSIALAAWRDPEAFGMAPSRASAR